MYNKIALQKQLAFVLLLTMIWSCSKKKEPLIAKVGDEKISLSKMTFSHQMVRIIFLEQLYRSFTILKNEPYHNN